MQAKCADYTDEINHNWHKLCRTMPQFASSASPVAFKLQFFCIFNWLALALAI